MKISWKSPEFQKFLAEIMREVDGETLKENERRIAKIYNELKAEKWDTIDTTSS